MAAFPPQRTYKATPLTRLETQTWLATYLQSAETAALLQPDALLTASGPASAQGTSSVTMHNLRRLLAGLNGKYDIHEIGVVPADSVKEFKGAVVNVDEIYAESEWQDKSEFEREQSVEVGDIDEQDPGHGFSKGVATAERVPSDTNKIDKAARKKAKKERRKQAHKTRQVTNVDDD